MKKSKKTKIKDWCEVRNDILKQSIAGCMGYKMRCPSCGIECNFYRYVSSNQCPICNPTKNK